MLTRYGLNNIIIMLAISALFAFLGIVIHIKWISVILWILAAALAFFTFWFFRDPERNVPKETNDDASLIISPADGKIVEIVEEFEPHYLKSESKRISIFLSPLDVHVNRSPVTGIVRHYEYKPGEYLVAYHPKSSEKNEQSRIGVETSAGKVFFKQIVGIVARRLVCELKTGDSVVAGERFGMMKFGSRMDIAVPPASEFYVKIGDRVVAGETIIGKIRN